MVDLQAFSSVGLLTQYVTAHACPLIEVNCECELVKRDQSQHKVSVKQGIRSPTITLSEVYMVATACMHGCIILPTLLEKHKYTRYIHA